MVNLEYLRHRFEEGDAQVDVDYWGQLSFFPIQKGMDVVDPVSKFIVLLLQHFLLPSGTEEQQDHIDDKEDQQHDFQADTDEIFIPDHALGDIFWKNYELGYRINDVHSLLNRKERQYRIAITSNAFCTFEFNLTSQR